VVLSEATWPSSRATHAGLGKAIHGPPARRAAFSVNIAVRPATSSASGRSHREALTTCYPAFAIRDTYSVDIAEDEDWLLLLACVLALDLAEDREHRDN
jgi:hypothetical protein